MIGANRGRSRARTRLTTSSRTVRGVGGRSGTGEGAVASPRAFTSRLIRVGTSLISTGVVATQTPLRHWLTTTVR